MAAIVRHLEAAGFVRAELDRRPSVARISGALRSSIRRFSEFGRAISSPNGSAVLTGPPDRPLPGMSPTRPPDVPPLPPANSPGHREVDPAMYFALSKFSPRAANEIVVSRGDRVLALDDRATDGMRLVRHLGTRKVCVCVCVICA